MITAKRPKTSPQDPRTDGIANTRAAIKAVGMPTGALRAGLQALACEPGPKVGLHGVKLLRPLVREMQEILGERLASGGPVVDYLQGRARLADSALVGLLHLASVATRMRGDSMIAPLAAVAVGGYGRNELAPGSDLDVLFLLPESSGPLAKGATDTTAACIEAVVAGLWDLGFTLDHAARSSQECLDLARSQPAVLAGLLDRRFLWGGYGLFAALNTGVAELFSGPDAAHWSSAVGAALASAHRDAPGRTQTPDDEPDVKRDPGGLRDLQRALSAVPLPSGRVTALTDPMLIEAHRFLWLVRCHLHLLAGRVQDRLTLSFQPAVARRLGLQEPEGATAAARLLNRFRCHAHNVLQAATLATASAAVLPR
jgi:[protein-PII] uridylyltransferase